MRTYRIVYGIRDDHIIVFTVFGGGKLIEGFGGFWTRESPERVRLAESASRVVHGAHAVAIFYDPDFHSAWYHVKTGQHVNADPQDQVNDHPSLFVFTRGTGQARIGGVEQTVRAGEAVRVPSGVSHEFWNPHDTPLEFVIPMWGFETVRLRAR